jgi:hypothetical protein
VSSDDAIKIQGRRHAANYSNHPLFRRHARQGFLSRVVSQSLPAMFDRYLRGLTGHVAHPSRSIRGGCCVAAEIERFDRICAADYRAH